MKIGFALAGLFSILAVSWLAGVPVDPVNMQPAPTPTLSAPVTEATPPLTSCEQSMIQAVNTNSWGVPTYTTRVDGSSWSLTGVAGSLREWQWDSYRDGPAFDLVQIYYQHETMRYPLWAVVGVMLVPYYTVHDSATLEYYKQQGHSDQPYYISFVEGAETRQEVLALFSQPGKYRITLQVKGQFTSAEGIDWVRCEPRSSEYCTLARFFVSLSPSMEDIPFQGESNQLIHTGSASSHPMYGFLIWPVRIEQTLNLCPISQPKIDPD